MSIFEFTIKMPQLFQVLRCFRCFVFQVHQTKKSSKFQCKMCGENQSIKRHYGLGTGQECRLHVQKLNRTRGEMNEVCETSSDYDGEENGNEQQSKQKPEIKKNSKWSSFVEEEQAQTKSHNDSIQSEYLGDREVVLEIPKKCRKLYNTHSSKKNKTTATSTRRRSNTEIESTIQSNNDNIKALSTMTYVSGTEMFSHQNLDPEIIKINDEKTEAKENKPFQTVSNRKINHFVPPIISKASKWAQYTEDFNSQNEENICFSNTLDVPKALNIKSEDEDLLGTSRNAPDNLFSLCEDNELDDVLEL